MATLPRWRKTLGAIKDTTTVSLANLNSDFKDLDVAIVKATDHVERPPKERQIGKILAAISVSRPRPDIIYCIHALARRLSKTRNWTVALKTLIIIHRSLRDGDQSFREELLNFSRRAHMLQLSSFKDDSSHIAWDCSAWVRTYALFLEERLECFKVLKYDVEAVELRKSPLEPEKGISRTRELVSDDLLEQLPALQQLLYRLVGCRPEGASARNHVIQYALALVLKESFKIYCAINDGIINLVDKFFEMPRHEAFKALDIYKRAGQQAGSLSEFYESCRELELARNFQFPILREPPKSFLTTMEDYVSEAPRVVSGTRDAMEFPERLMLTYKPEEASVPPEDENSILDKNVEEFVLEQEVSNADVELVSYVFPEDTGDLLGLSDLNADAAAIEERNAVALAIVPNGSALNDTGYVQENTFDPSNWELAIVTAPSSNNVYTPERQLAGGLDQLTLDSLYDAAAYREQPLHSYGPPPPNPFLAADPFAMSNHVPVPPAVQMAEMAQQQQQISISMASNPLAEHPVKGAVDNPFGDPGFGTFPINTMPESNPFGNPGLL